VSAADAGADVRANRAAAARLCHAVVRLFRADQPVAAYARGGVADTPSRSTSPA
jgi:hypothetical protein